MEENIKPYWNSIPRGYEDIRNLLTKPAKVATVVKKQPKAELEIEALMQELEDKRIANIKEKNVLIFTGHRPKA